MTLCAIFRTLLTLIVSEAEVFCSGHMQNLEPGELHIFELSDMKDECPKGKLHLHDGTVTVKLDMLVVKSC